MTRRTPIQQTLPWTDAPPKEPGTQVYVLRLWHHPNDHVVATLVRADTPSRKWLPIASTDTYVPCPCRGHLLNVMADLVQDSLQAWVALNEQDESAPEPPW